jgi:hypothetical protein
MVLLVKSLASLLASSILLCTNGVDGRASEGVKLSARAPERSEKRGDITAVYLDKLTNKLVYNLPPGVSKRGEYTVTQS